MTRHPLLVLPVVAWLAGSASTSDVKGEEAVRVEVRVEARAAVVNHELSLREIQAKSGSKTPRGTVYLVGVTRMELELGTRIESGIRTTAGGEKGVWVEGVEVRLGYRAVEIFIPREYAKGTCPYEAVLEHEQEHVERDRALLEGYAARLEKALQNVEWPTAARPLDGFSEVEAKKRLEEALERIVKPSLEELKKKREEARAALDTRKNYEAMRHRCD